MIFILFAQDDWMIFIRFAQDDSVLVAPKQDADSASKQSGARACENGAAIEVEESRQGDRPSTALCFSL